MTSRRRRITFRLGTLMLLVLLAALWLARQTNMARRQREAVDAVKAHGGWVHYDWEYVNDKLTPNLQPPGPAWLRRRLGDEFFQSIRSVSFVYDESGGRRQDNKSRRACDEALELLSDLPGLRSVMMQGGQATDAGLAHLGGVTGLEDLYIWDSHSISDAGVAHLKGLTRLKNIHLDKSKVTDEGFLQLARMERMEHLVLEWHSFSDRGLDAVSRMKTLKWLCVGGAASRPSLISDRGLAKLSDHVTLTNLQLSHTQITDDGLKHLAGLTNLTILDLEECKGITDAGLPHLAKLENLRRLLLRGSGVSGAGLDSLRGLKKLRLINLPERVSQEDMDRFKAEMPAGLLIGH